MHDHAAPDAPVHEPAPRLAGFGLAAGIVAVLFAATVRLAPAGFLLGIVAIVVSALGFVVATIQTRSPKVAVAGVFCGLFPILFWLLAREDIGAVAGGRDAWPDWLF
jgi:hypothetical protein